MQQNNLKAYLTRKTKTKKQQLKQHKYIKTLDTSTKIFYTKKEKMLLSS